MASLRDRYQSIPNVVRTTLWSAGRAFVGAFVPLATGIWVAPDFATEKAAFIAALVAGVTAAVRVIQHAGQGTLTE